MNESVTASAGALRRAQGSVPALPAVTGAQTQSGASVAPELVPELGEPWGAVWRLLSAAHGEHEAAQVLARLVGAVSEHGEDKVDDHLLLIDGGAHE